MDARQLVKHLNAHSATCARDAIYWHERGETHSADIAHGKAEAFATAAAWVQETLGE